MQSILDLFEQTFEDRKLSSSEKKALNEILGEESLPSNQIGFIRNRLFEFARMQMKSYSAIQVLEWLERANKILLRYHQQEGQQSSVYFSPGNFCREAIIQNLRKAESQIDICVFTISDDQISNVISDCYDKRIDIRIITDDDKSFDRGSDVHRLAERGIKVRADETPNHMHHKFAIIDQKVLLTGSYNWTRSAAKYNHENVLLVRDMNIIRSYQEEFEKLWKEFTPLLNR